MGDPTLAAALAEASSWVGTRGIQGVGQGETEDGAPCIVLYVDQDAADLPDAVAAVPVRVERTGPFQALDDLPAARPPDDVSTP